MTNLWMDLTDINQRNHTEIGYYRDPGTRGQEPIKILPLQMNVFTYLQKGVFYLQ